MTCQIKFHTHFSSLCVSPVDSRAWGKPAGSDKTEERQEQERQEVFSTEPQKVSAFDENNCDYHPRLKPDFQINTPNTFSLKVGTTCLLPICTLK